jgi:hypothetical protein
MGKHGLIVRWPQFVKSFGMDAPHGSGRYPALCQRQPRAGATWVRIDSIACAL